MCHHNVNITLASLMFNIFKILRPWKRVKGSAWMLEAMPKPQGKLCILMPLGFKMTPPAPALPRIVFAAPSKNREYLCCFVAKSLNSFVKSLICQSLVREILFALFWNWISREEPQFISCSLRFKSSLSYLRLSLSWLLNLTTTSLASCS